MNEKRDISCFDWRPVIPIYFFMRQHSLSPYGEEFPNLKYPLPLTFWSNLST